MKEGGVCSKAKEKQTPHVGKGIKPMGTQSSQLWVTEFML